MKAALVFGMVMGLAAPALAQDKTAIEKLNERFSAAFVKGDIATVAEMYEMYADQTATPALI